MRCPHCSKEIHFDPVSERAHKSVWEHGDGISVSQGLCPACNNLIVSVSLGQFLGAANDWDSLVEKVTRQVVAYPPFASSRQLPPEVPEPQRVAFSEAERVLPISPNASAALSRRLLQNLIREQYGISRRTLQEEIAEFLATANPPTSIAEAVDAVRNVGNYAAHPLKDTSTGEIVDAEPGEAEWLLDVLDALFDFAFVQPERLKARKAAVNEKLRALGKKEMP